VLVLPVAIYLTRHSESYELLHAGFTIPVALVLGLVALRLARRSRRRSQLTLTPTPDRVATAARILGGLGICIALAALVALAVYGLLEYAGTR
jgi:ABC-type Fe3+ transport system permease subunit